MKPFEEKYTLWLDGKLTGRELEAFEAELGEWKANAGLEKTEVAKIGGLLRAHLKAPPLGNEDFFNHQILQQIAAEQPKPTPATRKARFEWSLTRLLWAGVSCLLVTFGLFVTFVAPAPRSGSGQIDYYAQILNTQTDDPSISATSFHSKKDDVTVLWLDGLAYVPRETTAANTKR